MFKKDLNLQQKITTERLSGLTNKEIAEINPQYSETTYKRFFAENHIESASRTSEDYREKQRASQKKAWSDKSEDDRAKHVRHLSELSKKQKGSPLVHTDEWRSKNLAHMQSERMSEARKRGNRTKKKYTESTVLKKAESLGVTIEGDLSNSDNSIIIRQKSGAPRTMQIKKMMISQCIPPKYKSIGETEVGNLVSNLGLSWYTRKEGGYEIDIHIPSLGIGIEYNGLYWHSEANDKNRDYHIGKSLKAKAEGIRIIHIFENEWMERKSQVSQRLISILTGSQKIFYARLAKIVDVLPSAAKEFVNAHHIQLIKKEPACAIGLEVDGTLVSVATFGHHHRDSTKIVLNRFVTLPGTTVVGGLSRLSHHASKRFDQDIISWCDLRWSEGDGYLKAGWEKDAVLPPDYFYIDTNKQCKVVSKQSRQKRKINTPEGMTEYEHSLVDGLSRVWDCGKIRFVFRKR